MQASTTLRGSGLSKRMAAYVIVILVALALVAAAAFATRSLSQSAPSSGAPDSLNVAVPQGHGPEAGFGMPECDTSVCIVP